MGTSVLNPGAGFLRILTVAFDRLFQVRLVNDWGANDCPAGFKVGPAGLEPHAGARKRRKAFMKKTRLLGLKHALDLKIALN